MNETERRWLHFAAEDLRTAELTLQEGIYSQACFHAQQCVEKALKALAARRGFVPPRTHSIAELLHLLPAAVRRDAPEDLAAVLDTYYIATRYPDAIVGPWPEALPGREDACLALDLARQAMRWVEKLVNAPGGIDE